MQRDPRRCPGAARRRLGLEIITAISMFEDPGDECRFGDHGNDVQGRTNAAGAWMRKSGDTHGPATARATLQVDIEHPVHDPRDGGGRAKQEARAEALHPVHRGRGFGLAGLSRIIVLVVRRGL